MKKITPRPAEHDANADARTPLKALPIEVKLFNLQQKLVEQKRFEAEDFWWRKHRVGSLERFVYGWADCFVILLIIWLLRSFVAEPFLIPSGSMEPNLYDGDLILTTKYDYGVKLPVVGTTIIPTGKPKNGDIIVFRYPKNPKLNYIKRVIGVPGDEIMISGEVLVVNGQATAMLSEPSKPIDGGKAIVSKENLLGHQHLVQHYMPAYRNQSALRLTVPEGHYFVMGDNRDGSEDSRSWGYVPEGNILGKARFIWFNTGCLTLKASCSHVGTVLQ
ncbi:MAG: signal peptidase I [Cardiobacteriaceae bacterium]|nr:signal peptidase I [Cardiobacteriaceae bacterium]